MLVVYTDGGSSSKGGGVGGCAAIVLSEGGGVVELSESFEGPQVTNNTMELAAVLLGLYYVIEHPELGREVTVVSDSEYVVKGASGWLAKWKTNNWKTGTGAVKNYPLWQAVDELNGLLDVKWQWVRGHTGDRWNERADELATAAYTELLTNRGIAVR